MPPSPRIFRISYRSANTVPRCRAPPGTRSSANGISTAVAESTPPRVSIGLLQCTQASDPGGLLVRQTGHSSGMDGPRELRLRVGRPENQAPLPVPCDTLSTLNYYGTAYATRDLKFSNPVNFPNQIRANGDTPCRESLVHSPNY